MHFANQVFTKCIFATSNLNTNNVYYRNSKSMEKPKRLLSLDTLRGFDMLWIMGAELVIVTLSVALGSVEPLKTIASQMHHVSWDGFKFYDMIFPLFLFIAGISFPFSQLKRKQGDNPYPKIIKRGLILVVLGMIYNGLLQFDFAHIRIFSVLGRIGLAWMLGAIIFLNFKRVGRIVWCVSLLVGYWLLLRFAVAPDAPIGATGFSYDGNIVGYVDRVLFTNHLLIKEFFDPEGLLSTIPAVSTALLGMFAGEIVIANKNAVRRLVIMGAALVAVGLLWSLVMPINKSLWSSSFTCLVGGLSALLFALFYWVIDVKGWSGWTLFFRVVGLNSITIYMATQIIGFGYISRFFVGGVASALPPEWGAVVNAIGYLGVGWLFLWFMYRQKLFLKI